MHGTPSTSLSHEPCAAYRCPERTQSAGGSMRSFTDLGDRLVGRWNTRGFHPLLPGEGIAGQATFEWLDGHTFLIWRSHFDQPLMHYFDRRGVHRVYEVAVDGDQWRYWRNDPGFQQSFTAEFGGDGDTMIGRGRMNRDDAGWEDDLSLDYQRRAPG